MLRTNVTKDQAKNALSETKTALEHTIRLAIEQEGRIAARLDQTLITLATVLLVFPLTFLKALPTKMGWIPLLILSWIAFFICILLVVNAMQEAHKFARDVAVKRSKELKELVSEEFIPICEMSETDFPNSIFGQRSYASFWRIVAAPESEDVKRLNLKASIAFAIGLLSLFCFVGLNL